MEHVKFIFSTGTRHSGSRILSQILYGSGIFSGCVHFAGEPCNDRPLKNILRTAAASVLDLGNHQWNTDTLFKPPPACVKAEFQEQYTSINMYNDSTKAMFIKYPDALFFLPWIYQLMPETYFIEMVRHPSTLLSGYFMSTEDYEDEVHLSFVENYRCNFLYHHASVIYYQFRLVQRTLKEFPNIRHLRVRFEDVVSDTNKAISKIEDFLGEPLIRDVPIDKERANQKNDIDLSASYPFLGDMLSEIYDEVSE